MYKSCLTKNINTHQKAPFAFNEKRLRFALDKICVSLAKQTTILLFQFSGIDIIILFTNFFCEINVTCLRFGYVSVKRVLEI